MSKSVPALRNATRARLQEHYDRMWSEAIGRIRSGNIETDPVLAAGLPDRRRGLTVIARPSPQVRQRVAEFLCQLRGLEPEQHYYAPSEFHVTVLSLFTATVEHKRFLARTARYVAAVDSALRKAAPFRIDFSGVTASPGAIMIQGFFESDGINGLRDALRQELRVRGLAAEVDTRYRLETAHMTIARFRDALRDSGRVAAALERARSQMFGVVCVKSVSLVQNDWYMTRRVLHTIKRYRLRGPPA